MGDTEILYFTASWCGPCRMYGPVMSKWAEDTGHIVTKVDVDDDSELARDYNILSVPTLVVLHDGEQLGTLTGARPYAKLVKDLAELGVDNG